MQRRNFLKSAAALAAPQVSEQEGIRNVRTALDAGVNFLDNCWDYNDGESERRIGRALQDGYRQKAFLMTKIDGRTPTAAQKQLEDSLRRLKTDHIDLMQVHEVIRPGDPPQAFRPLPQEQMTALLAKTVNASVAGQYEKYKTSKMFDGTNHNPQYLG